MISHDALPERITQARELTGHSKSDVAEELNVSVAAVAQWESGTKRPNPENLAGLSRYLRVPMSLFLKPKPAALERKGPLSFRAWKSASTRKANRKAERLAEMTAEIYFWLSERIALPIVRLPEISRQGIDADVEAAAIQTRREWGLGDRPLLKLGELLESNGIFLCPASFDDNRFDAFSCIIDGHPMIFLGNNKKDRARSRFDAAHELGHIVLHQHLATVDLIDPETHAWVERQANKFASAFLLPKCTFGSDVTNVTLNGFLRLKPKWGVSVQAMVVRSRDLGLISEEVFGDLFKQIGWRKWRRPLGEPLDDLVPEVSASFARKSLRLLERSGLANVWEVPSLLQLPISIVEAVFQLSKDDLDIPEPVIRNIVPFTKP